MHLLISIADITGVHPESNTSLVYLFLEAAMAHKGTNNTPQTMIIIDI